jgi:hypothetical protein
VIDEFASLVRDLPDFVTGLAEGASAGIHLVMTGDRSLLAGRIAAMCEDKLVFKLAERDDCALARRGCLTAPQTIPEGDLIGARLPRDSIGRPPRPGRAPLNVGDGTLVTVAVPV